MLRIHYILNFLIFVEATLILCILLKAMAAATEKYVKDYLKNRKKL